MANKLNGKTVAILVADGFEQVELTEPKKALEQAGARALIVSPATPRVQGYTHFEKAQTFQVDEALEDSDPSRFDALLLPGGVMNPDQLRMNPAAVDFVSHFVQARKPIAAICHGPWTLIEADAVRNRTVTSWPSLRTDLKNAGAQWVDEEVVVDQGLVTSRKPDDLPAFNAKMIEEFAEGVHERAEPGQEARRQAAQRKRGGPRSKGAVRGEPGRPIAG